MRAGERGRNLSVLSATVLPGEGEQGEGEISSGWSNGEVRDEGGGRDGELHRRVAGHRAVRAAPARRLGRRLRGGRRRSRPEGDRRRRRQWVWNITDRVLALAEAEALSFLYGRVAGVVEPGAPARVFGAVAGVLGRAGLVVRIVLKVVRGLTGVCNNCRRLTNYKSSCPFCAYISYVYGAVRSL